MLIFPLCISLFNPHLYIYILSLVNRVSGTHSQVVPPFLRNLVLSNKNYISAATTAIDSAAIQTSAPSFNQSAIDSTKKSNLLSVKTTTVVNGGTQTNN